MESAWVSVMGVHGGLGPVTRAARKKDTMSMLWLPLYYFQSYIRSFISPKRRFHRKQRNVFIKLCASYEKAWLEYCLITEIRNQKPSFFTLPKAISVLKKGDKAYLLTRYVKGRDLMWYIERFLWSKDRKLLNIFFKVGRGLRELSDININLQDTNDEYESSKGELLRAIEATNMELCYYNFLTPSQARCLIRLMKNIDLDFLLEFANIHGGLAPSNILILDKGLPFFLDFESMFRGPRYVDLMLLLGFMYSSTFISSGNLKDLNLVKQKIIEGYYEKECPDHSLMPLEILYMLREAQYRLCSKQRLKLGYTRIIDSIRLTVIKNRIKELLRLYRV